MVYGWETQNMSTSVIDFTTALPLIYNPVPLTKTSIRQKVRLRLYTCNAVNSFINHIIGSCSQTNCGQSINENMILTILWTWQSKHHHALRLKDWKRWYNQCNHILAITAVHIVPLHVTSEDMMTKSIWGQNTAREISAYQFNPFDDCCSWKCIWNVVWKISAILYWPHYVNISWFTAHRFQMTNWPSTDLFTLIDVCLIVIDFVSLKSTITC